MGLIRPDYRPDLDPENPLYGTRIHQSPTKPLNSNHQTQSIRTAVNQPVIAAHQTNQSHSTEVQNIAKIERIDEEEEPSTQDSNLMSRFHTELIDEYNEEVDKYRRKRLRDANKEVFKKPYPCEICFTRFHSQGELITHFATKHTEPNFSCTRCNIKFVHESELLAHSDHC